ncbi:MAG: HAMP domain-containing protein [Planctomycetaceae bacterium]|nr:HAMP domain-containing protein [Planctomycetaceae bacterium]
MKLRAKITLIVAGVVASYALLDHALQRWIVQPRFDELERRTAQTDASRVRRALTAELSALEARCSEWAAWNETCAFVAGARDDSDPERTRRVAEFRERNLGLEAFRQSRIDLLYLVDADGSVRFGRVRDLESGAELRLAELDFDRLTPGHPFLLQPGRAGAAESRQVGGLVLTGLGPMFVASRPLACGEGGSVILGRILSPSVLETLAARTEVPFEVLRLDGELPARDADVLDEATASVEPVVATRDEHALDAWVALDDLRGRPALLVRATLPRSISASGSDALRFALVSTIAAGMLLLFVLLAVLRRAVIDPIARLTDHALEIGRTDDYGRKVALERDDELGVLSRELESMMGKLETSRAQLVDTARAAGMSEIATGILHNVGNVLNSVSVSSGQIAHRLKESRLPKLLKLAELVRDKGENLGAFIANDPKGKHVAPFLLDVSEALRQEREELEEESRALQEGVEHIAKLVQSQQELAGHKELLEPVELGPQVALAWSLVSRGLGPGLAPQFEDSIPDLGRVLVDRHRLVQVLVNLLKNACESVRDAGRRPGRITVGVERSGERLSITVSDDGLGFDEATGAQLFRHGFTTKPGGHGFGLHSCANAATEMGGSLSARSDGPGRGATFVLEIHAPARRAAA